MAAVPNSVIRVAGDGRPPLQPRTVVSLNPSSIDVAQGRPAQPQAAAPPRRAHLLTIEEAAEILAVSVRTMKNLMWHGQLAYVKIGRATRIDPADLDAYVTRNRRKQRRPRPQIS
jgi:excisionase family DNA binding protein